MARLEQVHRGEPVLPAIVFVHGLGGDLFDTWVGPGASRDNCWLHWVGQDTGCDTWTLGYDAALSRWQDQAMPLSDQGTQIADFLAVHNGLKGRFIVLVGHSMGGLVIKTLITQTQASGDARARALVRRICGVAFVATPHQGSHHATVAKAMTAILRSNPQVGDMSRHDVHLRQLASAFREQRRTLDLKVVAFAERRSVVWQQNTLFGLLTRQVGVRVVDDWSGDSGLEGVTTVPLAEDHFSICKPSSRDAHIHQRLVAFVKDDILAHFPPAAAQAEGADAQVVTPSMGTPASSAALNEFTNFYLGTSADPRGFVGRDVEMDLLDEWFASQAGPRHMMVIAPIGRGKTSLLVHWIARQARPRTVFVPISIRFGINRPDRFHALLATKLAALAGDPVAPGQGEQLVEHCHDLMNRLDEGASPVLIVIDGMDEMVGWSVEKFLLRSNRRHIRFLLSARPRGDARNLVADGGWLEWLGWRPAECVTINLAALSSDAVAKLAAQAGLDPPDGGAELMRLSHDGDPLLLGFLIRELVEKGGRQPDFDWGRLANWEAGFGRFWREWCEAQKPVWGNTDKGLPDVVERLLCLLSTALGPLRHADLEALLDIGYHHGNGVNATQLAWLDRFVEPVSGGYVLGHPRLGEYLRNELFLNGRQVRHCRDTFLTWGKHIVGQLAAGVLDPQQVPPYLLHAFPLHLSESDAPASDFVSLTSINWLRAWEQFEDGHAGFMQTARDAAREIAARARPGDPLACWRLAGVLATLAIKDRMSNLPLGLLKACVDKEFLTLSQAMRRVDLAMPEQRVRGLSLFSGAVTGAESDALYEAAHRALPEVRSAQGRIRAITALLEARPSTPERDALEDELVKTMEGAGNLLSYRACLAEAASSVKGKGQLKLVNWLAGWYRDEHPRFDLAHDILPHVDRIHRQSVIDLAASLSPSGRLEGEALAHHFPYLDPHAQRCLWQEAWLAVSEISDVGDKIFCFVSLFDYLDPASRGAFLDFVLDAGETAFDWRTGGAVMLASVVPGLVPEAVLVESIVCALEEPLVIHGRTGIITSLLDEARTGRCLDLILQRNDDAKIAAGLNRIAPHLSARQLARALSVGQRARFPGKELYFAAGMLPACTPEARRRWMAALEQLNAIVPRAGAFDALREQLAVTPVEGWQALVGMFISGNSTDHDDMRTLFLDHAGTPTDATSRPPTLWTRVMLGPDQLEPAQALALLEQHYSHRPIKELERRWVDVLPLCKLVRCLPEPDRSPLVSDLLALLVEPACREFAAQGLAMLATVLPAEAVRAIGETILARMPGYAWRDARRLSSLLPHLAPERRAALVAEMMSWAGPSYGDRIEAARALMPAIADDHGACHAYLCGVFNSYDSADVPIEQLGNLLDFPDDLARLALTLLPQFLEAATSQQLLEALPRVARRLAALEGADGVDYLLGQLIDTGGHFARVPYAVLDRGAAS